MKLYLLKHIIYTSKHETPVMWLMPQRSTKLVVYVTQSCGLNKVREQMQRPTTIFTVYRDCNIIGVN